MSYTVIIETYLNKVPRVICKTAKLTVAVTKPNGRDSCVVQNSSQDSLFSHIRIRRDMCVRVCL